MTWDADGSLGSVTGGKGATGYVYDADGNLLLQENPGATTLYLPGEQLTATTSGTTTTVTGARIIPLPVGRGRGPHRRHHQLLLRDHRPAGHQRALPRQHRPDPRLAAVHPLRRPPRHRRHLDRQPRLPQQARRPRHRPGLHRRPRYDPAPAGSSAPTPSSTPPTPRTSTPTTTPKTTPSPTPTPPGCAPPARTTTCSRSGKCARTPRRPARPRSRPAPRSTPPPAPPTPVTACKGAPATRRGHRPWPGPPRPGDQQPPPGHHRVRQPQLRRLRARRRGRDSAPSSHQKQTQPTQPRIS